ncbi:hypothetical protein EV193_115115 [Herbihabitans rhizosphaerae]|uniref:CU044_5270 family protein n=1 Tax=Herbihabitans rhizosphaerae TaxID=1872711 RepID=A0A4Q7KDL7_9PSEU|nr:CU044_5270 family protein [Herbihabitans rhizosphaerae]RZS31236.1 hypothetical protein EV193_115115 [Herbihabitans rhizosphaerae]
MGAERQIRDLLSPLDPVLDRDAQVPPVPTFDDATDLARRRQWSSQRTRRSVLTTAAAATVALAGVGVWTIAGPNPPRGLAATPAPLKIVPSVDGRPADIVLREIADRAGQSPVPALSAGRTEYLRTHAWSLHSQVTKSETVSALQATQREIWVNSDGSGRESNRTSPLEFESTADLQKWEASRSGDNATRTFGPGGFSRVWNDRPPTDMNALRTWLQKDHPPEHGPAETIVAVTDLLRERVLTPAERAAVLRVVADLPGLHNDGDARDRAGRLGKAFSLESSYGGLPTRYTLVISSIDGQVLSYEQMLPTTAGKLNVRIPAVISYENYLQHEFR